MQEQGKIWFTSDIHGYHRNIAGSKVSQWKTGYRDFDDEVVMTTTIANTINKYVKYNDVLYSLGDWSFGNVYNIKRLRDQINCQTIHHILGNHCDKIRNNKEFMTDEGLRYAQDFFTSVQDVITVKIDSHTFFLSHYAHRVWLGSHKSTIHLYGHSHHSIPDYGKSMDVGVDVAYAMFGEYRPFSLEEILIIMNKKQVTLPDRHDIHTNIK